MAGFGRSDGIARPRDENLAPSKHPRIQGKCARPQNNDGEQYRQSEDKSRFRIQQGRNARGNKRRHHPDRSPRKRRRDNRREIPNPKKSRGKKHRHTAQHRPGRALRLFYTGKAFYSRRGTKDQTHQKQYDSGKSVGESNKKPLHPFYYPLPRSLSRNQRGSIGSQPEAAALAAYAPSYARPDCSKVNPPGV